MKSLSAKVLNNGPMGLMALGEAAVFLLAARALLKLWGANKVGCIFKSRPGKNATSQNDTVALERCAWAIAVVAKRSPVRALCFERGITAMWMLRRRGFDPTLYYGLRMHENDGLKGHVWVLVDGYGITGAGLSADYKTMASFPPDREHTSQSMSIQLQPW